MREGQASQTARRVASQRRRFDRVVTDYGQPEADQQLHDDVAGELPFHNTAFTEYLMSRTRFFDGAVVSAVARGCPQVVVVGAGYDGRSFRYAHPAVRWFELDHPATVADKSARLARLGLDVSAAVQVPADFGLDDVGAALARAGHDDRRASLIFCEGVTPYLDREVVARVLASLRGRAAAGSCLAIDFALTAKTDSARRSRERLRALVEAQGEPFRLELPGADLGGLLSDAGWDLQRAVDPAGRELEASDSPTAFVTATPLDESVWLSGG